MSREVRECNPFIREASRDDCILLAKHLRQADLEEISHSSGLAPQDALLYSYAVSDACYSAWLGDKIILVFGCGGIRGQYGCPWMLSTDLLGSVRREFVEHCRTITGAMLDAYDYLENYIWVGNKKHIHWLKWLGFTICEPTPHGIDGEPFHRFFMKR